MRFSNLPSIVAAVLVSCCSLAASGSIINLSGIGDGREVEGDTIGGVTVSSTGPLGLSIYNSSLVGRSPNPDPDLFVAGGPNLLIMQSTNHSSMTGDFFDVPDDFAGGGVMTMDLSGLSGGGLTPTGIGSLLMVDIDAGGRAIVTLFSGLETRTYDMPNNWTSGSYPTNFAWLDVSVASAPVGPGSNGGSATFAQTGGFSNASVVDTMTVKFFGSGGVGFSGQVPEPATVLVWTVLGLVGAGMVWRRRAELLAA